MISLIRNQRRLKDKIFDYFILVVSWISIITSIVASYLAFSILHITNLRPYLLNLFIFILGIAGYKLWRKENLD